MPSIKEKKSQTILVELSKLYSHLQSIEMVSTRIYLFS